MAKNVCAEHKVIWMSYVTQIDEYVGRQVSLRMRNDTWMVQNGHLVPTVHLE